MRPNAPPAPATLNQAATLLAVAIVAMVAAGIEPHDRAGWLLESIVPAALLLGLGVAWHWCRLSPVAYVAILVLIGIHELGAHFTYAEVPYDDWVKRLTGHSLDTALGWQRNQYDRLVHFSYGLLIILPIREALYRLTPLRGAWLAFVALTLVLATSSLYELIEWLGGEYLGNDQARAFLATQKDPWDAQKDMALALLGALIAVALSAARRLRAR